MACQSETRDTDDAVTVETTVPEVDDEPPEHDPFCLVKSGMWELPEHDEWECSGPVHQSETDDHQITWKGEHGVPGYPWSEKALVSIETDGRGSTYHLVFYPFDEDGETRGGLVQPSIAVEYDRLRYALKNAEAALDKLAGLEHGDVVVIDGTGYEY